LTEKELGKDEKIVIREDCLLGIGNGIKLAFCNKIKMNFFKPAHNLGYNIKYVELTGPGTVFFMNT